MQGGQRSALRSNTSLPGKNTGWVLSSAPSASLVPGSRSAWPTWSIISSASHGSNAELRLLDLKSACRGPPIRKSRRQDRRKTVLRQTRAPVVTPSRRNHPVLRALQIGNPPRESASTPLGISASYRSERSKKPGCPAITVPFHVAMI